MHIAAVQQSKERMWRARLRTEMQLVLRAATVRTPMHLQDIRGPQETECEAEQPAHYEVT